MAHSGAATLRLLLTAHYLRRRRRLAQKHDIDVHIGDLVTAEVTRCAPAYLSKRPNNFSTDALTKGYGELNTLSSAVRPTAVLFLMGSTEKLTSRSTHKTATPPDLRHGFESGARGGLHGVGEVIAAVNIFFCESLNTFKTWRIGELV